MTDTRRVKRCIIIIIIVRKKRLIINLKIRGSVATNIRYGGVVNHQIKKDLFPSLSAKKN